MPLTVLSSADVRSLLLSLTRPEILGIQNNLAKVLREYSTGDQRPGGLRSGRKGRQQTIIRKHGGLDSILMPLDIEGSVDTGFEMMNVPEEDGARGRSRPVSVSFPRRTPSPGSARNSISSAPPDLGGSSSTGEHPSAASSDTAANADGASGPRSGYLIIADPWGMPTALINTQDLIPFRCALCALLLFWRRRNVEDITVFGAGRLAFWHIHLALLLRGSHIKHVDVFNRSFDRSSQLLRDIYSPTPARWRSNVKFATISSEFKHYDRDLMHSLTKADVIFCCTSSPNPLFPAEYLVTPSPSRDKGQFICAAGSCRPNMTELDPRILKNATEIHRLHRRQAPDPRGGMVVVDTMGSCLLEAGEIVQSKISPFCLVEVGELIMADNFAERGKTPDRKLLDWIQEGDVVYKSVGLGMLDLVLGKEISHRAVQKGIGTTIPDF